MKRKLFIILSTLVLIITLLLLSFVFKDNKENNKEISKVEKLLSKPEGIQAYTLNGKKTDISYNNLIEGYEIDSITCKNGTIATYNKEDNSVSLSNIHMPDYCTMDFKKGIYTLTFNSGNLLYDLKDVSNINSEYITYSVKDEVVTVTGKNDDGYGFINARVYLEANNTYIFNCDTNGVWGTNSGTNTVEAFLMLNGEYNTFYHLYNNKKFEFTPNVTGVYWLRLDVNATNKTYTFYNINISKNISSKNIGYKDVYGEFPTYSRDGYMMLGWYLEDGTKVDSTSINYTKRDHSITAKWSRYNYEVKLNVVNGSGSATKTVEHGSSVSFTGISPSTGYSSSNPTISCTGGSLSGSTVTVSNVTSSRTCTVTFKKIAVPLYNQLLADNPTISTRTDFSTTFTNTNTGTLYKATESIAGGTAKDVYYFAGDAKNNWVKFGGFYWRIIRTNADGSIRMLYSGTSPDTTNGYIDKSAFNSSYDNSMYAGYMYGTSGTLASNRTNTNNSTIKGVVDTWYNNSLSSYTKYISTTAVYCNDREIGKDTYVAQKELNKNSDSMIAFVDINDTSNLIAAPDFQYNFKFSANIRLLDNKQPTYNCTNIKDAFSGSNTEAKLTYPIGLMTADEVVYAGANTMNSWSSSSTANVWYYLNSTEGSITGSTNWWTITPSISAKVSSTNNSIYAAYVDNASLYVPDVYLGSSPLNNLKAVRPVISIKQCALWSSGSGSYISPYEVNGGC